MALVEYLKETKAELKHVSWPTRKQAISFTVVVIAISIFTALFLGLFDTIFSTLLKWLRVFIGK
ncbi:MAG: preprotein translocase subunit SecE [Candidatus Yonathbacteria bacterium]|nr:preprotein translocase subunit SecE [Candidatus Yonathbacteria bacterium]